MTLLSVATATPNPRYSHSNLTIAHRRYDSCSVSYTATTLSVCLAASGTETITNKAGCPIAPISCGGLVALVDFMRLSLMKGAHANLSSTAWQEIGVKPGFGCPRVPWGSSGIPQHSTCLFVIRSSRLVWQVEKALTDSKIAMDARPGGPVVKMWAQPGTAGDQSRR
jgi:hypothetical protein